MRYHSCPPSKFLKSHGGNFADTQLAVHTRSNANSHLENHISAKYLFGDKVSILSVVKNPQTGKCSVPMKQSKGVHLEKTRLSVMLN